MRLERLGVAHDVSRGREVPAAGQHLEEDRAERINIGALIHLFARLRLFRRHVFQCAHDVTADGERLPGIGGAQFCETEIGDERLAILAEQNIARLQIAVKNPVLVRELHRLADLQEHGQRLLDRENPGVLWPGRGGVPLGVGQRVARRPLLTQGNNQRFEVGKHSGPASP